jgi:hypothetical protein
VILQVKNQFACKNDKLKKYKNVVWDTMELFKAFSLESKNGMFNERADVLVVAYSTLQPCKDLLEGGKLDIIFKFFCD